MLCNRNESVIVALFLFSMFRRSNSDLILFSSSVLNMLWRADDITHTKAMNSFIIFIISITSVRTCTCACSVRAGGTKES